MKLGCGTDIIEISRIKDSICSEYGEKFLDRIYTKNERAYCNSKNDAKYQHYAARFAAKEATFKAISKLLNNKYDIEWKQMEVRNDEDGKPIIIINHDISSKIESIELSISHCKEYATANVVAIFK